MSLPVPALRDPVGSGLTKGKQRLWRGKISRVETLKNQNPQVLPPDQSH
jgi:hypothetical protein